MGVQRAVRAARGRDARSPAAKRRAGEAHAMAEARAGVEQCRGHAQTTALTLPSAATAASADSARRGAIASGARLEKALSDSFYLFVVPSTGS